MKKDKRIKELDKWLEKSTDEDFKDYIDAKKIDEEEVDFSHQIHDIDVSDTFDIDFSYKNNGVQDSILTKLKRLDCKDINYEVDLHGYPVKEAINKLHKFVIESYNSEIKFIKVICGKGINSKDGIPKVNIAAQKYIKNSKTINAACVSKSIDGGYGVIKIKLKG